jgi:hypothetical protein
MLTITRSPTNTLITRGTESGGRSGSPGNDDKESAFAVPREYHAGIDQKSFKPITDPVWFEQSFRLGNAFEGGGLRQTMNERELRAIQPMQHFCERMLGLVRVLILVHEPGIPFRLANSLGNCAWIEEFQLVLCEVE